MRGKKLLKIFKALELLSKPNGASVYEMSEKLRIEVRSVHRMLDTMQEMGFPIWDEKVPFDRKKRWKMEESYLIKLPNLKLPDFRLTYLEIILLHTLKNHLTLFNNTIFEKHINSAFFKINQFIPDELIKTIKKINSLFISKPLRPKFYEGKEEIIEILIECIMNNKSCQINYHSFYDDKIKDIKINPLHFFENNGGFYVVIQKTDQANLRILAIERIKTIQKLDVTFDYPQNINPATILDSSFDIINDKDFKVEIWFSNKQARYISEKNWSNSQNIKSQKDGSIVLSMETSGWMDVKRWVMSYGSEAKLIKPKKMIDEIATESKKVLTYYN